MKRNKGVSMITLIITIIVIIILAAIAFVGMDDATGSAQYARFSSEFGDYATNFTGGAVTKVQESLGLAGKVANKAQIVYCAARGVDLSEFDEVLNGVTLPGGYTSTRFQTDIKDATGATYVLATADTPCYEIKDDVMKEYTGKKFYGDSNGEETHWVTASGVVFTLPGYPRVVDGEERMYINAELYYVPGESGSAEEGETAGNSYSVLLANSLVGKEPITVVDKSSGATVGSQKVADAADHVGAGGTSGEGDGDAEVLAKIKVGDYVEYTPDTAVSSSVKWRVWAIEGNDIVILPTEPVGSLQLGESGNAQKCFEDYRYAVEKINEECAKYGNNKAKSVRSLTLEDLEKEEITTLSVQTKEGSSITDYGKVKTYSTGNYFASKYNEDTDKNEMLDSFVAASSTNKIKVKQTEYSANIGWKHMETTTAHYGELLGSKYSWLASTGVICYPGSVGFQICYANEVFVKFVGIGISSDSISNPWYQVKPVRPLITLSSKILENSNVDNGEFATWNIK